MDFQRRGYPTTISIDNSNTIDFKKISFNKFYEYLPLATLMGLKEAGKSRDFPVNGFSIKRLNYRERNYPGKFFQ